MDTRDAEEKKSEFESRLVENGDNPAALLELGKSCFLSERYDDAIAAYLKAISLDKNSDAAYYNLGVAFQAAGKYLDAKKAFLKSLELNPNYSAAQDALNDLTDY